MKPRTEPPSGGSSYGIVGASLFHVVSAFEAWIASNFVEDGKIHRSMPVEMDGALCMMIMQAELGAMIIARKLEDLTDDKARELGIDLIGHLFNYDDWILYSDHLDEDFDPIVYDHRTGQHYSVNGTFESVIDEQELTETTTNPHGKEAEAAAAYEDWEDYAR